MRGYFGLGVEGISKPRNVGSLYRSAHAFGGSFVFAVAPAVNVREVYQSDTSEAAKHMPLYEYGNADDIQLPKGCKLVGVELCDDAVWMPSFRHPLQAAYILGPERGSLSPEIQEKCDHLVKIPTKFCVNVGIAGAIMLYDRQISLGRWADRPIRPGGPTEALPEHVHGGQIIRSREYTYDDKGE
ncbi:RNA methyltransferase [Curvivirga sp.]|uniref:RNA methyltransferase n=1 Tax=Curvivirga sp. TaxID=2856848 RepID=UPI003B5C163C